MNEAEREGSRVLSFYDRLGRIEENTTRTTTLVEGIREDIREHKADIAEIDKRVRSLEANTMSVADINHKADGLSDRITVLEGKALSLEARRAGITWLQGILWAVFTVALSILWPLLDHLTKH